eukprot:CAMPEP_0115175706 /NCGR_PEP_ID=MMETSP0270-20121206/4494_1 /TAXON_ID=71861 /ORGANISM="Scrippsiella trochoidea, Strain CCMP3099" /LENGTH=43 /DNA_ID= /DNA_START= /DNA_END= /DNA_ORIENTATION=
MWLASCTKVQRRRQEVPPRPLPRLSMRDQGEAAIATPLCAVKA